MHRNLQLEQNIERSYFLLLKARNLPKTHLELKYQGQTKEINYNPGSFHSNFNVQNF